MLLNMLSLTTCKNIINIGVESQMKLADSLNNEENNETIYKIKKEIEAINIIIQSITDYMLLNNYSN